MISLNKVLKKKSLKSLMPKIVAAGILAVLLLAVAGQGLFMLLLGPTDLSETTQADAQGKYVSFDASEVIVAFATWSKTTDSETQVLETYYLLPYGENQYIAVMDAKEQNGTLLDRAMEQSHEYYMGDLETLTRMGTISGTVKPLDDGMDSYMVDCIENYTLPGYEEGGNTLALVVPIQVNLNQLGFLSRNIVLLLGGLGLLFLVITLILLIPVLAGTYQKKAMAQVLESMTQEEAQQDFAAASVIENVHAGAVIWYQKGAVTKAIKAQDILWGYIMPEPLVVSKYRWPVSLYDENQNCTRICFMEKKDCQKLLDAIAAQGHPFIGTYTSELAQKFKNDLPSFMIEAEENTKTK